MAHSMVDLETKGSRPGCAILSIGAVAFDYTTQKLGPEFYTVISSASCVAAGLHEDRATMAWWSRQSEAARAVLRAADASDVSLGSTLDQFSTYLRSLGSNVRVWGCGASFDNAILAHCYAVTGRSLPWRYTNDRCYRTLKNLVPSVTMERAGVHHHALADAKSQAVHAMRLLRAIAGLAP